MDMSSKTRQIDFFCDHNHAVSFANGCSYSLFIEWSKDAVHPAVDSPKGCRIDRFSLATSNADELRGRTAKLNLDVDADHAPQAALHAKLTGPKGILSLPG